MGSLLEIENLNVSFTKKGRHISALNSLNLQLDSGRVLAVVGESGSGKTTLAMSILGLLDRENLSGFAGRILYKGTDLTRISPKEMNKIRGAEISMIFQEPQYALNPAVSIGRQIEELLIVHKIGSKAGRRRHVYEIMEAVGLPDPPRYYNFSPSQLSGGMKQRVVIAMAMVCGPSVIIADEPTTALDVTTQAQILSLLKTLKYRRHIQTVFQDPGASLDPKMSIGTILLEPILLHDTVDIKDSAKEVERLLEIVGLDAAIKNALPNELSSGQKQIIAIAKALSTNPRLVVCDEPVSALDVSIQSHILNLLMDVKKQYGMTYLFISHSLGVIRHVSDRIGIMYLGRLIETGTNEEIFSNPLHPYTRALLSASTLPGPDANKERIILSGEVPSCTQVPDGCPFHPRCPKATAFCSVRLPIEKEVLPGHSVECHLYN